MNRMLMGLLLAAVLTVATGAASAQTATPRVDRREARQHARIRQGAKSGQLTPRETARLKAGHGHVQRMEGRAKADGVVTPGERTRLNHAQNRQSRHIRRLKHKAPTR